MRALILQNARKRLQETQVAIPEPRQGEVLIHVHACGVCRTDLHIVDGELAHPKLPLIPGHEIVGEVVATGAKASRFKVGIRVGVPWLGSTCGTCALCRSGRENLCDQARFTGYTLDGGYAEYAVANERFCFEMPDLYSDAGAAPLLCAGFIGYRSFRKAGDAHRIGIYGFGAAAHIIAQVARFEGREVYAFTRKGDTAGQAFAKSLGAAWVGDSSMHPPERLDAALIFAQIGALVPVALSAVCKGGTVVCGGIHMSPIPAFPYELLWEERAVCSVANLTRQDGEEFFTLAPRVPVRTRIEEFPLSQANEALDRLRAGQLLGAAVLIPGK